MTTNKIEFPKESLFFQYRLEMFCAIVLFLWQASQRTSIGLIKANDNVVVGGDGRCDYKCTLSNFCQLGECGVMWPVNVCLSGISVSTALANNLLLSIEMVKSKLDTS